jgi:hypothetical protein
MQTRRSWSRRFSRPWAVNKNPKKIVLHLGKNKNEAFVQNIFLRYFRGVVWVWLQ